MISAASRRKARQIAAFVGGIIVVGVIVWIDIATGLWQNVVILSGLAAGLVTFILTVVVLDRIVQNSTARRWAPINRLAITEFLHAIVDDDASEVSLGEFVPRTLTLPQELHTEALTALRGQVVEERRALSDALSRWTAFLASSGDNESILLHIANIALQLDIVRDAALDVERRGGADSLAELREAVDACNNHSAALVTELQGRLQLRSEHRVAATGRA